MESPNGSSTPHSSGSGFEVLDLQTPQFSQSNTDDVAIVGLSCRTAGGNDTPEKLWDFLLQKKNASGDVPAHRWEPWRQRDPRNSKILDNIIRKGYFLDNLEDFDAAFFGISPKEAELMDPHQRLGLELAWEALENSGIDPKKLNGSDTAVYMGVDSDDYSRMLMEDLPTIEAWSGIGTAYHGIPNRISYHLGLQGPSTAVDAACASSLIAIHLARQAIVSGESTVAICGGVNVVCAPGLTHMLQKAGALTTEGVCRSFDDEACGYARGEGGAVVVLKRLSAAIEDNDNILAVLKSSASAQDGKTNGIMAPNSKAQELVARQALSRAGNIDPHTIDYVEAHATSTSLGDPTEINAIAQVYGTGRSSNSPCYIGSIKPNVGHLEAAAGAIGFVKAVLSVQKGVIAPQTLLNKLNTKVNWANSGLEVVREQRIWPEREVRRAAVCCYGYGGSVCHAILEQAPDMQNRVERTRSPSHVTLTLSAMQEKRLPAYAASLAHWLSSDGALEGLSTVARTLSQRRAAHDYRVSFVVSDHEDAVRSLTEFAKGRPDQWVSNNRILNGAVHKGAVWVFSGHGAQWPDMGEELLHNVVFHHTLSSLDEVFYREAGFSVLEALETGELGSSAKTQVLTYAVQVGLTAVLKSRGVVPQAIIGHSVGEIAAAVAAGCLTAYEGAIIVSRRARLYAQVQGQGAMILVTLPYEKAAAQLSGRSDIVAAIRSSPATCVVSGTSQAIDCYVERLESEGVKFWRVKTDIAFHSPMLEQLVSALRESLGQDINPQPAVVPIYSTSSSDPRTASLRDTGYWTRNMVETVWLVNAVEAAIDDGLRVFMEVSTHPIVSHSISETLSARSIDDCATFGIMAKDTPAERSVMKAVSHLYTLGAPVDFGAFFGEGTWSAKVPTTPWVHKPYWKNISMGSNSTSQQHDVDTHTVLGSVVEVAGSELKVWTTTLDDTTKPYPLTHPLDGTEIIPAAVYCNTFQKATGATALNNLELRVPTPMAADKRELQVIVEGDKVRMASRLKNPGGTSDAGIEHAWIEHSATKFITSDVTSYQQTLSIPDLKTRAGTQLPNGFAWDYLQKIGVSGIAFPWAVLEHFGNDKEMLVKMDMDPNSDTLSWDAQSWAPFLDAATSVGSSIFFKSVRMRIVSGIDQVFFLSKDAPPKIGYLFIEESSDEESLKADISVLGGDGVLLTKVKGMRFSDVEAVSDKSTGVDSLVHRLLWVPPKFAESPLLMDNVVLVSADSPALDNYVNTLEIVAQKVVPVRSHEELKQSDVMQILQEKNTIVVYLPGAVDDMNAVPKKAHAFTWETASILSTLADISSAPKLFVIADSAHKGQSPTCLAQYPLYGFARVAASEYPAVWGGLIDNEGPAFPLLPVKYVKEQSVVRIQDGLPRIARLRPFAKEQYRSDKKGLLPQPHGTYLVTGGFGDLGLEVLEFLVHNGARRIVVISRRGLPPRKDWASTSGPLSAVVKKVSKLESLGATIHALALDIGSVSASAELAAALDRLSLPPVLGVVHAAGVSGYGYIKDATPESYSDVMGPKVQGALNLHSVFPSGTLDFFVLFSSIGQIIGTPGQSAYAASNAFLDGLATHRRSEGCNSIAIQWTAWRALGLASDTALVDLELHSKGVTDITVQEGFQAWSHLSNIDTDHAVVTRTRILEANEPLPCDLIADVVQRRAAPAASTTSSSATAAVITKPKSGPELEAHLNSEIKGCLSRVLHLDVEEIDDRAAIADLGVDSVMTVALRQQLQKAMAITVPPTLTWNHPTVGHLVEWFYGKLDEKK